MNNPQPLSLHGSCHCGRVSVELRTQSPTLPAARACGCSFCTKHGAAWTSDPQGELVLSHRAPDDIRRYRFGLGITDFIICAHCGVPCVAVGMVDDRLLGVVNINTMDRLSDFAPPTPPPSTEKRPKIGSHGGARAGRRRAWCAHKIQTGDEGIWDDAPTWELGAFHARGEVRQWST
tara:strand:+ start:1099 stop:1629 length:531 start_codon:yes stop_codon:yes gene_type:complete